jgi:hypothetical protein
MAWLDVLFVCVCVCVRVCVWIGDGNINGDGLGRCRCGVPQGDAGGGEDGRWPSLEGTYLCGLFHDAKTRNVGRRKLSVEMSNSSPPQTRHAQDTPRHFSTTFLSSHLSPVSVCHFSTLATNAPKLS